MLKLMGTSKDGSKLVVFGLSHHNLDSLRLGKPIQVDGKTFGVPGHRFLIFSDTDERTMLRNFGGMIGPKTEVDIDPRFKE